MIYESVVIALWKDNAGECSTWQHFLRSIHAQGHSQESEMVLRLPFHDHQLFKSRLHVDRQLLEIKLLWCTEYRVVALSFRGQTYNFKVSHTSEAMHIVFLSTSGFWM